MACSPLARSWATALLLCSGPVATVLVLWLAQAYVIPRYLSYLVVPLFVLLATGLSALLARRATRATVIVSAICVVVVVTLAVRFAALAPDVMRLPREANRDAAETIHAREPPPVVVLAYMRNPRNLDHYLGRPAVRLNVQEVSTRVCESKEPVAYVTQPFGVPAVEVPCLGRSGAGHRRFEQYARGEMNVWFVPPD
jgi:hypothetical protein